MGLSSERASTAAAGGTAVFYGHRGGVQGSMHLAVGAVSAGQDFQEVQQRTSKS